MPEIETERLRLRIFTPDDLDGLAQLYGDPEAMKYIATGEPASREDTARHLGRLIEYWETHDFGRWVMEDKQSGEFIGYCGLALFEGRHELMYGLARPHWGRGYATEAVRASIRYGFEALGLEIIAAVTRVENLGSQRVMQKAGMKYEGELVFMGFDYVGYVISRQDFLPDDSLYVLRRA